MLFWRWSLLDCLLRAGLRTVILLISAFQIARIIAVSHCCLISLS
jgi:hypothetical protein